MPEPLTPKHRRRRLHVSLRGLMVLVVLIGGVAGWLANKARTQRQAVAVVKAAGCDVQFDYQWQEVAKNARGRPIRRTEPAAPKWLRGWLGDELFQSVQRVVFFDKPASPDALAALAKFDRLERLTLGDLTGVGGGLRHLQGLNHLNNVWIAGPGVTDVMLENLAKISTLRDLAIGRKLNLRKTPAPDLKSTATDEGFARLLALRNLESLSIHDCPNLSDLGLARLIEGLPPLQSLSLTGGPKSMAATLPALARHHPDLENLTLDRGGVTDDDFKAIEGLTKLQTIWMQNTRISDAGLAHFRPLKNLTYLMANSTDIGDEGLKVLGELPLLQQLFLNKTKVTDSGIVHLEKLALKRLALGFNQITDAAMPSVAKITSLEHLEISNSPLITDAGLVSLRALKNLQRLDIPETKTTDEGIAALRQALPKLGQVTNRSPRRPAPPPPSTAK